MFDGAKQVVKDGDVRAVIKRVHDTDHLGQELTMKAVAEIYDFKKMKESVKIIYNECIPCCRNQPYISGHYPMRPIPVKGAAFRMVLYIEFKINIYVLQWGIDCCAFKLSSRGNKKLIVARDYFTKYPIMKPIREACAEETVRFLTQIIEEFGVPAVIITDQGNDPSPTIHSRVQVGSSRTRRWPTCASSTRSIIARLARTIRPRMA
jgi:hypothetical protein